MARGDASFARGNCDWPFDPRCQALPHNDARWLNEILWRIAVKERRRAIPDRYSDKYLAWAANISEDVYHESLRAMYDLDLIGFTEDMEIIVFGVDNQNPKLKWLDKGVIYRESEPIWMDSPPVTPHKGQDVTQPLSGKGKGKGEGNDKTTSCLVQSSNELQTDDPVLGEIILWFPIVGQSRKWGLTTEKAREWDKAYKARINVLEELRNAKQWLQDNPTNRKTERGMTKFLGNWLRRAIDRGTGAPPKSDAARAKEAARMKQAAKADEEQARKHAQIAPQRQNSQAAVSVGDILENGQHGATQAAESKPEEVDAQQVMNALRTFHS